MSSKSLFSWCDSLGLNVIIRQDNVIFITKLGATVLAHVDQSVDTFLLRCKLLATPPNFRSQNNVNISKHWFLFAIHNSEGISLATTQKPLIMNWYVYNQKFTTIPRTIPYMICPPRLASAGRRPKGWFHGDNPVIGLCIGTRVTLHNTKP